MSGDNNSHENVSVSRATEDQNRSSSCSAKDGIRRRFGSISRRQFLGVTAGSVAFTGSVSAQESNEEQRAYKYWQEITDKNWGYGDKEGFEATQLYEYHERFPERRGENINITIIDSGFDTDHPLFNPIDRGQRRREYHVNVVNRECFGTDCQGIGDNTARSFRERIFDAPKYHGTYVTGIIWQAAPNANYTIIRLGSDDDDPEIVRQNYLNAIEFAQQQTEYPPDVINISGGLSRGRLPSDIVETIDRTYNEAADDMVIVAAAGNHEFPAPPSTASNVISVSPLKIYRELHTDSAPEKPLNGKPDIAAPGYGITTINHSDFFDISNGLADNGDSRASVTGSSFASPHVAGIAALLSDHGIPDEVREAILGRLSTVSVRSDPENVSGQGAVRIMLGFDELRDDEEDEGEESEEEDDSEEPDDEPDESGGKDEPEEPEDEEETDDGEDTDPEDDNEEEETAGELMVSIIGTNGPVSEGDTLEVTAEIENTGGTELTQTIQLFIGTEGGLDFVAMDDETVTVAGGDSQTISLGYEVGAGPDADLIARVIGEDDSDETTVATSGMENSSSAGEESSYLNVF